MTKVWKPKEYLFEHGKIDNPKQRGRMSLENKAFIAEAVANGVLIEGYGAEVNDSGKTVVEKVSVDPNRVFDIPDEIRPESDWEAYSIRDGANVHVGMRTPCNTCKNSLTYCYCSQPVVNLDYQTTGVVYFKARTTPLPNKRW